MSITLLSGDCRDVLPTLAASSVHCVVTSPPYYALRSYLDAAHPDKHREIGSESTPDEYLATMVAVFREVRRVLRPDGTVWCNIGDSYAGPNNGYSGDDRPSNASGSISSGNEGARGNGQRSRPGKPKDLLMMPARLALALQADGWWVRSDIIWHKPNPMPESVTDRPTSAYEHVFLLTRSKTYFYDADAVREEAEYGASIPRDGAAYGPFAAKAAGGGFINGSRAPGNGGSRNLRNVWTLPTSPYSEAHFATFPPALAERCIRAGTSERGCCSACGAPWRREIDKAFIPQPDVSLARGIKGAIGQKPTYASTWAGVPRGSVETTTTGWSPSCSCAAPTQPCTVLDPFAGAGTTLLVADRLQRNAVGIELNVAYTEMAMERVRADAPLFVDTPEPQPVPGFAQPDLFAEAAD